MADIDFGQISEALNNKADLDIHNLNSLGKLTSADHSFPSSVEITLTPGASGTEYTAPGIGYFTVHATATAMDSWAHIYNTTTGIRDSEDISRTGGSFLGIVKARAGEKVVLGYSRVNIVYLKFLYAVGGQPGGGGASTSSWIRIAASC